ncbi:class I SAM-dependent methyltransferase [Phenylobacterium sp. VNQ135]|uniref:class I SAM-dependent methyltransferase n=1 Tax=Phenylobacterium sp. VNQ135 TaxID=3400922 RepID=UPI003BFCED9C
MTEAELRLRPASSEARACKVCGAASPAFGTLDFNRSCEEARGRFLTLSGVAVQYRRCEACGLIFTDAFDDWGQADFEAHIYNDRYIDVDPEYAEARPLSLSRGLASMFAASADRLQVLDYGAGNGRMAQALRDHGFASVTTYDPFTPEFRTRPEGRFDLVTCFETVEHMPDPAAGVADLASFVADDGLLMIGTLLQPNDIERIGVAWWYIGPRNGHVTLFTHDALTRLLDRQGLRLVSQNANVHFGFRNTPPAFARHLFQSARIP